MKSSKEFKKTIKIYLDNFAYKDKEFAIKYNSDKKSLNDCITYILNTVQKLKVNGFADDEIYQMALHYYDEDIIDIGKKISMEVKVNHKVEFTDEDKAKIKEEAKEKLINEEIRKMRAPKKPITKPVQKPTPISNERQEKVAEAPQEGQASMF